MDTDCDTAPRGSEMALAEMFTEQHAGKLIYVATWGEWMLWNGCRWLKDETREVKHLIRATCLRAAREAHRSDGAKRLARAATVDAVERLAMADRRHARTADAFDTDPLVLNTPGGVVDLRTGKLRPHEPGEMLTKVSAVTPGGDCPRWRAFILQIVQGDAALSAYIQRWCGYALTGLTDEQAFLFIVGPGGNGKSVLTNLMMHVLASYATTAPMETFMATNGDRHPTDLAGLQGARLVVAQETEAGRALAEAKIKSLTGGDPVKARFMRGNYFQYVPAFKLVMVGNHQPVIRNPDDAMRRRLHLMPLTFKPATPDPGLIDALKEEAHGILQWAIEGCLKWQGERLTKPVVVNNATAEYFADQDMLTQWVAERCEPDRSRSEPSSALFRDWEAWCKNCGEAPGTCKQFSAALERHFVKKRTSSGMMFCGLRLKDNGMF